MDHSTIKKKTFAGAFWKMSERILAQLVKLIVSIIIARLLGPTQYAVVGYVNIFFAFADLLITSGLNTALVQKKNADKEDYSTVLFASLAIAVICYVILFFLAPLIADATEQPLLIPIIRVMSLSLIVHAVKAVWCAYISSHLEFKKFFKATLGGTLFSAVLGITLAYLGAGPWAMVAQQMSNSIIDTIILMISVRIVILPKFNFHKFKSLFKYSWKILVSQLIGTTYSEVIPIVTGLKYSPDDLSYYTKGRQFPGNISSTITNTLSAILFPVLSKFQDNIDQVRKYTRRYISVTSYVVFPLMLGLFAVAHTFVEVVLGDAWLPSVYYIRVFSVALMFNMIHIGNCETIKAIGRSDVYLIIEIIKKALYFCVIAAFLFLTDSPEQLVIAFLVNEIIAITVNSIPNVKLIGYKVKYQLEDLIPNLLTAGTMAAIVYFMDYLPITHRVVLLVLQIIAGGCIYVGLSVLTKNKNFYYILNLIKEKFGKKKKKTEVK